MSHEPPVPPANQSPYPAAEPPHEPAAPLPPVVKSARTAPRSLWAVGSAIAAVGVAAGGVVALLLRRERPRRKRR